ncbi:sulfotransferase [Selenomonas sp. AB3002]|uniref:sulfotransferase n=1 Tax=Selenomonas sp. AB3002 TaxID=1392502 RepID=UPI00049636A2
MEKMTKCQAIFEENRRAIDGYPWFHGKLTGGEFDGNKLPEVKSKARQFLEQVESPMPILLIDAYDTEELVWMCTRLRTSEKYGADNRLYLQYTSWDEFRSSLGEWDWRKVLATGKVVFLFSEEQKKQHYPKDRDEAPAAHVMPLAVEEINEIIKTFPRSFSGSDFLVMIFDNHPSLLTVGFHSLVSFSVIYRVFCDGKSVTEAVAHMRAPRTDAEVAVLKHNLPDMLKYKFRERIDLFYAALQHFLPEDRTCSMLEWFKAFFLASNEAVGRRFRQRIAPAIFFDIHGSSYPYLKDFGIGRQQIDLDIDEMLQSFTYLKYIAIARKPVRRFGSAMRFAMKVFAKSGFNPVRTLETDLDLNSNYGRHLVNHDPRLPIARMVRFEDLKLYPRETLEKCCEFLRLPWSDTLLSTTVNGDPSGIVDGTDGFDTAPVYREHLEVFSRLDYYRMELLNGEDWCLWGYKHQYYDGRKFTKEELKHLFAIPWKLESVKMEGRPDWPDEAKIKVWHEYAYNKACYVMEHGQDPHLDKDGKPMKLVECLFPDLQEGQKMYE